MSVQFQDKRQLRNIIDQKLVKSGEKERLKQLLRQRLTQCGWRDDLKAHCKDVVKGKGMDQVSVEDLINEITPKGRAMVPESVKSELLTAIRKFLSENE